MKQFFTLLFALLFFADPGFSQAKTRYSYLTVTLQSRHDWFNGGRYLELVTDKDNPNSAVIDSLVNYKTRATSNTGAGFYYQRKDTSHLFYNHFRSVAECLEFFDDHGWQLFSVLGNTNGTNGNVSTDPVYYFRRER